MFKIRIFLVLGFLTSGFWALFLAPISALGSVAIPTMRSILADKGEANKQGEIQGIVPSIQSLTVIFAPLVLTYVFFASTRPDDPIFLPSAPFLLAAAIVGLALTYFVTRPKGSIGTTKTVS